MPELRVHKRGRPMKYGRAARPVTITLPEDVLSRLEADGHDVGEAIVKLVERHAPARAAARGEPELTAYGSHAVIVVTPNKALKRLPGVQLVPIGGGRALISLDSPRTTAQFELDLRDASEWPDISAEERDSLGAIAKILRQSRRSRDVTVEERTIIVLDAKRPRQL
jgi:hypothetical protein